jgi:methanogenic corrinoid protein MtbC1
MTVRQDAAELAELVREATPAIAVEVTEAFLERHPDWRQRYGARATTAGVEDAGYHLKFLAAAVDAGEPRSYAAYARWAARVLAARGIASSFLEENLTQIRDALGARLPPPHAEALHPYFDAAREALQAPVAEAAEAPHGLTTKVFLQAIVAGERHAAVSIARLALRDGLTLRDLYIDVFQTALYQVGACWESNRLTVAQEHMATAITQYVMAQIYEPPPPVKPARGKLIMTGVEGELHSIGGVMVGDLLETAGWQVRLLGTNLPSTSILATIREWEPSHVGISTTMLFNVAVVRQLIATIRREFGDRIKLMVGGGAFRAEPDLWRTVGSDGFAPDLRAVQAMFTQN